MNTIPVIRNFPAFPWIYGNGKSRGALPKMLMQNLETFRPTERVPATSHAGKDAIRVASYQIYRNGVLHYVVDGPESRVRNLVCGLYNQHPDDSWDYALA